MEWLLCGQPVTGLMRCPNPPMSSMSDIVGGGGGRREVLVLMRADVTRCQLSPSRGFTAPLTRRGQFTADITSSLRALALCLGAQCYPSSIYISFNVACGARCIFDFKWSRKLSLSIMRHVHSHARRHASLIVCSVSVSCSLHHQDIAHLEVCEEGLARIVCSVGVCCLRRNTCFVRVAPPPYTW